MDAKEHVLKTLASAGKPMKAGEIADAIGMDKKEVDKAIKDLKNEEKIISPKMCYYQPK